MARVFLNGLCEDEMALTKPSNEIKIKRLFNAPVKVVWEAWTDPKRAANWWGPRGFTLTTESKDLRPGGSWVYTMHGPDGVDYPNKTHYFVVEEQSKLVYDHGGNDDRPPLFRVTVRFSEIQGGTEMDMTMTCPTPEVAEEMRAFIKKAGGDSTWDRLAEYLEAETSGNEIFVINRSFDAPLDLMFEMWTNPNEISQWLPPKGFKMEFIRADIRPGGSSFYLMRGGSDTKMYGRVEYLLIDKPDRIIYKQQFADQDEKVARHPKASNWPETMLTIVDLTSEAPDRTRVTVTWEPYGESTSEELETFIRSKGGMTQGWTGSFDKLETLLAKREKQIYAGRRTLNAA